MSVPDGPIEVRGLRKEFVQRGNRQRNVAIEHLDLTIMPGEIVSIVGRTGCGKSTFLAILLGLEWPTGGEVTIGGLTPYGDFQRMKGYVAAVFQQDRLLPWRSALDNVKLSLEVLRVPEPERTQRARTWLERFGLESFLHAYPSELSGGMRQRVALARTFAMNVRVLLADEAFGHLDEVTARELRTEFVELARSTGNTSILVTHQLDEAVEVGGRILVFGRPARLLADIAVDDLSVDERASLRTAIQRMIDLDEPLPTGAGPGGPGSAASSPPGS